jgi:flagellar motor switch protein FliN
VSENIELEQLHDNADEAVAGVRADAGGDLRRLSAVPVDLSVEMGRARMTVGETLGLRQGSIITLNRMAGEPVDLLVNGTPIARGEVVVVDEQFGLRVTEVLGEPGIAEAAIAQPIEAPTMAPAPGPSAVSGPIEDVIEEPVEEPLAAPEQRPAAEPAEALAEVPVAESAEEPLVPPADEPIEETEPAPTADHEASGETA